MIRVNVNLVSATITENETLTSGRVGLQCEFSFSGEWDGLSKIAVFEGAESADVAILTDNVVTVPAECLSSPGVKLRIGAYGMNGDGDIVIPTVFANAGRIQQGAEPSGVSPADPTPSWAAQVQAAAASALEKATAVENEAANGDFDGADGADGADGVSPTINVTAITGGHKVTVTDAGGTTAFDVMDGEDGTDGMTPEIFATATSLPAGSSATANISGTVEQPLVTFGIPKGDKGDTGTAATVSVGTTTTGAAGSNASVSNSGTSSAAVFDFTIPKGDKGDTGTAATVNAGTTTTGAAGTNALVTNSGTSSAAVFDFTIPKGDKGDPGVYYGVSTPTDPDVTVWIDPSGEDDEFIPAPSSPTTGQFLKWSGTAWVASDLPVYSGGVS